MQVCETTASWLVLSLAMNSRFLPAIFGWVGNVQCPWDPCDVASAGVWCPFVWHLPFLWDDCQKSFIYASVSDQVYASCVF